MSNKSGRRPLPGDVILLKDLAPREDIQGGSGKQLFGQRAGARGKPRPPKPESGGRGKKAARKP